MAWTGLFLPFARQDLGREFLGSLKLLLATTDDGLPKHNFLTGDIYFLCTKQLNTILA